MGNWRTVTIIGTCSQEDVRRLADAIEVDADYANFHCLSAAGGLCGLPSWAATTIHVTGNLAERDYSVEAVAEQLKLLAWAAPSLAVKVHCGGDYEDTVCVATITVKHKDVAIGPPEVDGIEAIPEGQMVRSLYAALQRQA